ncbi:hypothetical protein K440DRAFT_637348 [Wilcoxina mikolae CBS 423.85]|nr:hypothetical protein K440DRAFT_637348 [Wilcoxina mikolae CBS 423.85]
MQHLVQQMIGDVRSHHRSTGSWIVAIPQQLIQMSKTWSSETRSIGGFNLPSSKMEGHQNDACFPESNCSPPPETSTIAFKNVLPSITNGKSIVVVVKFGHQQPPSHPRTQEYGREISRLPSSSTSIQRRKNLIEKTGWPISSSTISIPSWELGTKKENIPPRSPPIFPMKNVECISISSSVVRL